MAAGNLSDTDLIAACVRGEQPAWEALYRRYCGLVSRTVGWAGWSFPAGDREELVQDVFLELVRGLGNFRGESSLATFLVQIAKHRCISHLRKITAIKRRGEAEALPLPEADPPEWERGGGRVVATELMGSARGHRIAEPLEVLLGQEKMVQLKETFGWLSPPCQKILRLRFFQERSYDELCRELELPLGTVCSRLKRCILAFKRAYEKSPASL